MTQSSSDKFLNFTVGLLKDSEALEALRKDAVKHHMIDHPGQLIAMRLTEYYEMMNKGIVQPVIQVPAIVTQLEAEVKPGREKAAQEQSASTTVSIAPTAPTIPSPTFDMPTTAQPAQPGQASHQYNDASPISQVTGRMRAILRANDNVVSTATNADQNADEAADYWSIL